MGTRSTVYCRLSSDSRADGVGKMQYKSFTTAQAVSCEHGLQVCSIRQSILIRLYLPAKRRPAFAPCIQPNSRHFRPLTDILLNRLLLLLPRLHLETLGPSATTTLLELPALALDLWLLELLLVKYKAVSLCNVDVPCESGDRSRSA